ncbi:MAG: hypothetical protein K1Y36_08475 [Blastocatellia bacterium]|nr:hypothetical protein [Blastocatellia bacterium]
MAVKRPLNLEEFKVQAAILLKDLRSQEQVRALKAATRFHQLPQFSDHSISSLLVNRESIKLKHALTVIAVENKQPSWTDFKRYWERREALRAQRAFSPLYPRRCAGFLNEWHGSYEVARRSLEQAGGFLLPFRSQYFICTADYIRVLGLEPTDPDWERIGYDWVRPAHQDAWERLNGKLNAIQLRPDE